MSNQPQTTGPAPWYTDPAMMAAVDMMRQAPGGRGVPSHNEADEVARGAVAARVASPRRVVRGTSPRVSTQARKALAGRPVQPLPTRTARKAKARRNKIQRRLGLAAPVAMIVMVTLIFLIPPIAAVTMGLAVGWLILANMK